VPSIVHSPAIPRSPVFCEHQISDQASSVHSNAIIDVFDFISVFVFFLAGGIAVGSASRLELFDSQTLNSRMDALLEDFGTPPFHGTKGRYHGRINGPAQIVQRTVPSKGLDGFQALRFAFLDGHDDLPDLLDSVPRFNDGSDSFLGGNHELLSAFSSHRISRKLVHFDIDAILVLIVPIEGHRRTICYRGIVT